MFKSHPIILDSGPAALTLGGAGGGVWRDVGSHPCMFYTQRHATVFNISFWKASKQQPCFFVFFFVVGDGRGHVTSRSTELWFCNRLAVSCRMWGGVRGRGVIVHLCAGMATQEQVGTTSVKILGSNIVNCIDNPIWNLPPNSQLISSIQLLPPLNMLFLDGPFCAKVASGQTLKSQSK